MVCLKDYKMPETCEDCTLESYCSLWVDARRTSDDGERAITRHQDCPLIEVPKQKHGKWIKEKYGGVDCLTCSACGMTRNYLNRFNFCPNCDADMRGAE